MVLANELRRGNWVYINQYKVCAKVIYTIYQYVILDYSQDPELDDSDVEDRGLSDIRLSGDILEKAGFINTGEDQRGPVYKKMWNEKEMVVSLSLKYRNSIIFPFGEKPIFTINSLHKLQNLFFELTGEELEVSLPHEYVRTWR